MNLTAPVSRHEIEPNQLIRVPHRANKPPVKGEPQQVSVRVVRVIHEPKVTRVYGHRVFNTGRLSRIIYEFFLLEDTPVERVTDQ